MIRKLLVVLALAAFSAGAYGSDASTDGLTAAIVSSDTVHVAPPTGERETDRASILAALERVRPGGTVQFAPGTYLVGEYIQLSIPRLTFLGHSTGTTLRGCDPADYEEMEREFADFIAVGGVSGGASLPDVGRCGILELTGGQQAVRGLTFEHTYWGLILGCCHDGGGYRVTDGGHLVEGNTFQSSMNGIRAGSDWPEPSLIRGNRFIDVHSPIGVLGRTFHVLNNEISVREPDRVIFGHPGVAIAFGAEPFAASCERNLVAGNRIEGHPDGILLYIRPPGRCRDNIIRDNTIMVRRVWLPASSRGFWVDFSSEDDRSVVGVPLSLQVESGEGGSLADNLIEGNRIVGSEGVAIEVLRAARTRIVNNTITGVTVRDPFPGNTLWGGQERWREANGSGIWVSPDSHGNEIVGNTFEDIASHAVFLEGDSNHVEVRDTADAVRDLGSGNRVATETADLRTPHRAGPDEGGLSPENLRELTTLVQEWVEDGTIVGAEILVARHGRVVLHEALGWSDRERGERLQRNSVYRLLALTKPFTGTATLMLVDDGRLELDVPVSRWLSSWANPRSGAITVRQLLTHTAGWEQYGTPEPLEHYPSLRAAADAAGQQGPQHTPGAAYRYSDVHSYALGALVEEVSGVSIEGFIEERILRPLGLPDTHTGFSPDSSWAARVSSRYRLKDDGWQKTWSPTQPQADRFFRASGGLFTTAPDYARWLDAWMRWSGTEQPLETGDTGSDATTGLETPELLSRRIVREALIPGLGPYGMHWEILSEDPLVFGHGGVDGTHAMAIPSRGIVVVYFTQSQGRELRGAWVPAALRAVAPDLQVRRPISRVRAADAGVEPVDLEPADLLVYAGRYQEEHDSLWVFEENGRLHRYLPVPGSPRVTLVPLGDHTFAAGRYDGDTLANVYLPLQRLRFVVQGERAIAVELIHDEVVRVTLRRARLPAEPAAPRGGDPGAGGMNR